MSSAPELGAPHGSSLVDLLLEEQQSLSAVERFAEKHEAGALPQQARHYSDLIPTSLPAAGQQFAFRVDLDRCTGCKACVTACRSLNGLDPDETWRDVGILIGGSELAPVVQTVTTACHHCEDPGCLTGCPVQAYEKDEVTGIVRHLDDQCIGCQYCTLKCPYDVPKYNERRGIVRKCDMCADRLVAGEAPACVQACPTEAISIEIVDRDVPRPPTLLAVVPEGMPASKHTRPTTRYVGRRRGLQPLQPGDVGIPGPADAHTPLAVMLVMVQLSVGMLLFHLLTRWLGGTPEALAPVHVTAATVFGLIGLGASTLHLGRPLYAFRAFLGWRTSWMSREILALGPFAILIVAYTALLWMGSRDGLADFNASRMASMEPLLGAGALTMGLLGTACSVMIYVDTHRASWSLHRTAGRFLGSVLVLGPIALLSWGQLASFLFPNLALNHAGEAPLAASTAWSLLAAGSLAAASKLSLELSALRHCQGSEFGALKRSAKLLAGVLRPVLVARVATTALALACAPLIILFSHSGSPALASALAATVFALALSGEFLERHLFFRAEAGRAMPGLG